MTTGTKPGNVSGINGPTSVAGWQGPYFDSFERVTSLYGYSRPAFIPNNIDVYTSIVYNKGSDSSGSSSVEACTLADSDCHEYISMVGGDATLEKGAIILNVATSLDNYLDNSDGMKSGTVRWSLSGSPGNVTLYYKGRQRTVNN